MLRTSSSPDYQPPPQPSSTTSAQNGLEPQGLGSSLPDRPFSLVLSQALTPPRGCCDWGPRGHGSGTAKAPVVDTWNHWEAAGHGKAPVRQRGPQSPPLGHLTTCPLPSPEVPVRASPRQPLRPHEPTPAHGWYHQLLFTEQGEDPSPPVALGQGLQTPAQPQTPSSQAQARCSGDRAPWS